eukprot:m.1541325 g.1541325  ORF g.1541325 m.1541325 type:complete len:555 (-) comp25249_c0_seq60:2797-4461(-)
MEHRFDAMAMLLGISLLSCEGTNIFSNTILSQPIMNSLRANEWTAVPMQGNGPPPLTGASLSMFTVPNGNSTTNTTQNSTTDTGVAEWGFFVYGGSIVSTLGNGTSAATLGVSDQMYMMLQNPGTEPFWLQIQRGNSKAWPGPRWRHSGIMVSSIARDVEEFDPYVVTIAQFSTYNDARLVVFGGLASTEAQATPLAATSVLRTNEGWIASSSRVEPSPRWGHIACRRSTTTLLIFGGQSSGVEEYSDGANGGIPIDFYHTLLADTWLYDAVTDQWTNVTDFLLPTPPECGVLARSQSADVRSGVLWYIYGGVSTGTPDVLFYLDVSRVGTTQAATTTGWQCIQLHGDTSVNGYNGYIANFPLYNFMAGAVMWPLVSGAVDNSSASTAAYVPDTFIHCGGSVASAGPDVYGASCFSINVTSRQVLPIELDMLPPSWDASGLPVGSFAAIDTQIVLGELTTVFMGGNEVYRLSNLVRLFTTASTIPQSSMMILAPNTRMTPPMFSSATHVTVSSGASFVFALSSYDTCPAITSCSVQMWVLYRPVVVEGTGDDPQ